MCAARADALPDGAKLYLDRCGKCHGQIARSSSATADATALRVAWVQTPRLAFALPYGPNLAGIHGRPAGSVPGYDYSKAFLEAMRGVVWDSATLDEFVTDTQARAPGTRMYFAEPDGEVRRRIIAYLETTTRRD